MRNVVKHISAGIPRSLAGRIGLITLLGLVFMLSAALQLAIPCKPSLLGGADFLSYGDPGKTLVVMVFAGNQLQKTIAALERWETVTPCSNPATREHAVLMLYTDGDLDDSGAELKRTVGGLASINKCFQEVAYESALLKEEDNVYNKKRENHLWVRGPNQLFYTMMLKILPEKEWIQAGISHLFWMEPDNIPQHKNWLEHLIAKGQSGPYWIQGSSYRGDCIPEQGGNCTLIGKAIRAHINGNALYHVGDEAFLNFVKEVSEGEWKHWPFDLAMWKEVRESWPEPRFRKNLHLLQLVDWIRNYGPYPFKVDELPPHVIFVHADAKPAIEHDFKGNFTQSQTDREDTAKLKAAEEAPWLRQELERVKGELDEAKKGSGTEKPSGEDVAAKLGEEETRRQLLPAMQGAKVSLEPLARPDVAAAATSNGQVLFATVSAEDAHMVENYVRLLEKNGAARNLVLLPVDEKGFEIASGFSHRVGVVLPQASASHPATARLQALILLLREGFGVAYGSIVDVAWVRDPFAGFGAKAELQVALDARRGTRETRSEGLFDPFVSAGLHYSRPTPSVIAFWESALQALTERPQADADELLSGLLQSAGSSLKWATLDPAVFPNGPLYFEEKLSQASQVHPVAVHNTWVSPSSIVYRFREGGLWLPESAPRPGARYMTYFDAIEENGLNNQRQAFRNALALARILNRTLIMPAFHRLHRRESPVPMDYFFDVGKFDAEFPGVEPHRFLHEAFPDWETLPVQVMDIAVPPVPSEAPWLNRAVIVKPKREWHGATPSELLGWYGDNTDQLLVFHGLFRRFDKFDSPEEHARFNEQTHRALVPIPRTLEIAENVSKAVAKTSATGKYDCFHLRHSKEFLESQAQWGTVRPLAEIVQLLIHKLPPSGNSLYLTTDVPTDETRAAFLAAEYPSVAFLSDHFPETETAHIRTLAGEVTMREGQIDQLVCASAQTFIGNEYSTFTTHIAFLRQQAGRQHISEDIYDRDRQEMEYL